MLVDQYGKGTVNFPKRLPFYISVALCAITVLAYTIIVVSLQTQPFTDFDAYYRTALTIKSGEGISNFYKYFQPPGYFYYLAGLFKVFNSDSIILPQVFNIVIMTFVAFLLMHAALIDSVAAKIITFIAVAFSFNYLSLISVLCSEIPFALFFISGLVLFWHTFKRTVALNHEMKLSSSLLLFASGCLLGISQSIRSVAMPFLVLFSLAALIFGLIHTVRDSSAVPSLRRSALIQMIALMWAGFLILTPFLFRLSNYGWAIQPLQNGLWTMFLAFNDEGKGWWNERDAKIIGDIGTKHNWDATSVNKEFRPFVEKRVRENWVKQIIALPEKIINFIDPTSISYWALEKSSIKDSTLIGKAGRLYYFFNYFVVIVSLFGIIYYLFQRQVAATEFFAASLTMAVFSYMIVHFYFFEIQSRYANHLWILLFWLLPANAAGVRGFFSSVFRRSNAMVSR